MVSVFAGGGDTPGDGGPATRARLGSPWAFAVDAANNLYIADFWDDRVRKVSPDGLITTVAGNGTHGYSSDGGPATSAQLNFPATLAVDPAGNLFIGDTYNSRINAAHESTTERIIMLTRRQQSDLVARYAPWSAAQ